MMEQQSANTHQYRPTPQPRVLMVDCIPIRLEDAERTIVVVALVLSNTLTEAAQSLGLSHTALKRRITKYAIDWHYLVSLSQKDAHATDVLTQHNARNEVVL